jgi:hypothetical protein
MKLRHVVGFKFISAVFAMCEHLNTARRGCDEVIPTFVPNVGTSAKFKFHFILSQLIVVGLPNSADGIDNVTEKQPVGCSRKTA